MSRALLIGAIGLSLSPSASALNVEGLEPPDAELLRTSLQQLEPLITARKPDGTANLLAWEELYQPLSPAQQAFLDEFRALKAEALGATSHYFGEVAAIQDLVAVGPQQIVKDGIPSPLDPQFLPREVHQAYLAMMDAMEQELGRRLLVESGYRSPAYQLYLFLFYLPTHEHSVRETNR
ncbi:MAG: hypothetical protein HYY91_03375, partial [Candidatus Omnitrophica bacterium]|nr:hypothetical protein [Candidatus Omnitrophota bacterium]